MLTWEWAAQFGSFVGGVAAGAGLIGLVFLYFQWRDARKADQQAKDHRDREEERRETDERRLAMARLAEEITVSTNLLLVERSKLWAQALDRFPADIVARSVLAAAAVRTTISTTGRIEAALKFADSKGFGDELLRSIDVSLAVLGTIGKEDITLVNHLQDYDLRFSKLSSEIREKLAKQAKNEAEHEMLAFHSTDGLIQSSEVFMHLNASVTELGGKVRSLQEELERQKSKASN